MKDFIAYDRFKQKMEIGFNIRLSELQALMIYSVVKEYKEIIKNKSKIAKKYIDACNSFKLKYINQNEQVLIKEIIINLLLYLQIKKFQTYYQN